MTCEKSIFRILTLKLVFPANLHLCFETISLNVVQAALALDIFRLPFCAGITRICCHPWFVLPYSTCENKCVLNSSLPDVPWPPLLQRASVATAHLGKAALQRSKRFSAWHRLGESAGLASKMQANTRDFWAGLCSVFSPLSAA